MKGQEGKRESFHCAEAGALENITQASDISANKGAGVPLG